MARDVVGEQKFERLRPDALCATEAVASRRPSATAVFLEIINEQKKYGPISDVIGLQPPAIAAISFTGRTRRGGSRWRPPASRPQALGLDDRRRLLDDGLGPFAPSLLALRTSRGPPP
jgi:hypothetical protein